MTKIRHRSRAVPASTLVQALGYCQNRNPATGVISPIKHSHTNVNVSMAGRQPFNWGEFCRDEIHPGPPYRTGGDFKCMKINACLPFTAINGYGQYIRPDGQMVYTGGFQPPNNADFGLDLSIGSIGSALSPTSWLFPSMNGLGDRAYNGTKPHLEKAGLAVFIAELRDLPRMLKTSAGVFHDFWRSTNVVTTSAVGMNPKYAMTPKKSADNFLNHQFGWAPFLKDIAKFYDAIIRTDEHVTRLSRQNGQWVRRRIPMEGTETTTLIGSGMGTKVFPNSSFDQDNRWNTNVSWFLQPASWQLFDITKNFVTGVGKFRFYRPEFDRDIADYTSVIKTLQRRMTIYGLRINPSNIYKATPWTWAIDWVSKVGDHVDHLNDILVDSVACEYAYVMRHQVKIRRFIQTLPFASGTVRLQFDRIVDTKQREGALSPYGFGLTLANLTPRQIAIAGALGITRRKIV